MKKERFEVTGMTCSACSARVEKAVAELPGTAGVSVNLLTNSMQLSYDEAKVSPAQIIEAVEKAGYGEYFGHSLGHGTGLEIHENPRYAQTWDKPINADTIVSIEPGIYLPKKFGVRIEDLALVTETGIINFVTAPKELIIL